MRALLVVLLVLSLGCDWATPPLTLSGAGSQQSAPFHLDGAAYRLAWSATSRDGYPCIFSASVRPLGNPLLQLGTFASSTFSGAQQGESWLYPSAPGDYYLDSHATCESWSVAIGPV